MLDQCYDHSLKLLPMPYDACSASITQDMGCRLAKSVLSASQHTDSGEALQQTQHWLASLAPTLHFALEQLLDALLISTTKQMKLGLVLGLIRFRFDAKQLLRMDGVVSRSACSAKATLFGAGSRPSHYTLLREQHAQHRHLSHLHHKADHAPLQRHVDVGGLAAVCQYVFVQRFSCWPSCSWPTQRLSSADIVDSNPLPRVGTAGAQQFGHDSRRVEFQSKHDAHGQGAVGAGAVHAVRAI